mmetsp:Transcript_11431/g.19917  ORF Transcript_11431/g.19917 Transcript_11431/m.19917 type:complete len:123 (-) Transcript_11431:84-452(-)
MSGSTVCNAMHILASKARDPASHGSGGRLLRAQMPARHYFPRKVAHTSKMMCWMKSAKNTANKSLQSQDHASGTLSSRLTFVCTRVGCGCHLSGGHAFNHRLRLARLASQPVDPALPPPFLL